MADLAVLDHMILQRLCGFGPDSASDALSGQEPGGLLVIRRGVIFIRRCLVALDLVLAVRALMALACSDAALAQILAAVHAEVMQVVPTTRWRDPASLARLTHFAPASLRLDPADSTPDLRCLQSRCQHHSMVSVWRLGADFTAEKTIDRRRTNGMWHRAQHGQARGCGLRSDLVT